MSLSTLKPVACRIPPVAEANDSSLSKLSKVIMINRQQAHPPLQVKGKEKSALQQSLSATSRREMMHLTAASIGLLSLLLPASAEAGTRNATMRQKIMEKLKELRRMAGLSKPKDDGEEKKPEDETEGKSKVQSGTNEAKPKPKDEGEEKKPKHESKAKSEVENGGKETKAETKDENKQTSTHQDSKVAPVIPALPGIINGKSVETTLSHHGSTPNHAL